MQQKRFYHLNNDYICLVKAFRRDLVELVQSSMQASFGMIMSIDSNENMRTGQIHKQLTSLGLIETSKLFSNKPLPAIYFRGRHQIDAVWVIPNINPTIVSITPFYFRAGNHRLFVLDFQLETILGSEFIPICKVDIKRLISSQLQSVTNYIERSEQLFEEH